MSAALLVLLAAPLFQDAEGDTAPFERVLRRVRTEVGRSVVAIEIERTKDPEGSGGSGPRGSSRDYYNRPKLPTSGTILTEDGYILTSAFNLSGEIRRIRVTLHDGRVLEGRRLGSDEARDIGLLKVEATGLPVLPKADLEKLKQGDFVAIVGRSPDPDTATINHGILSATGRMKGTAVQTDAELNYGNVGGPLVTLKGELIGVSAHIRPRQPWGQSGGVGFATKITEIDKVFEELKTAKTVARSEKGAWLGVLFAEGGEGQEGVQVLQVVPNSPAEEAGVEEGDLIVEFEGKPVKSAEELKTALSAKKPGDSVEFKVKRTVKIRGEDQVKEVPLKAKLEKDPN